MPLLVLGPFLAHHQEVVSVSLANGICFPSKWSVGRTGPPTDHLEGKHIPFATHTLDGIQMGLKNIEAC
jgi:hypothetical protein